jgi:hypothetical protein
MYTAPTRFRQVGECVGNPAKRGRDTLVCGLDTGRRHHDPVAHDFPVPLLSAGTRKALCLHFYAAPGNHEARPLGCNTSCYETQAYEKKNYSGTR